MAIIKEPGGNGGTKGTESGASGDRNRSSSTAAEPLPADVDGWFKTRYVLAFVSFWGFVASYMVRININLAIVDMVVAENETDHIDPKRASIWFPARSLISAGSRPEKASSRDSRFEWDEWIQGHILGSFFFGYVTTQLLGGRLADRFGGKNVFGIPLLCGGLISICIPHAAHVGHGAVIGSMVLMGMCHGFSFPAMFSILARWVPAQERSRTSSVVFAGTVLGTIVTLALGGLAIRAWGWKSTFYISGGVTVVWFIFWLFLTSDSPADHPRISHQEKLFLLASISAAADEKGPKVPWKSILTSKPFWALLVAHSGANFGYWALLTQLPTYMDKVLNFDLHHNGLLSSIPYLVMFMWAQLYGLFMDQLITKDIWSVSVVRKVSNTIAQGLPAICLIVVAYIENSTAAEVFLLSLAGMFQGSIYSGCIPNHVDLAPNFAGSLMGITNTVAAIVAWSAPVIAGSITANNNTVEAWRTFFWVCAGIMMFSVVVFLAFGSGEEQPWNEPDTSHYFQHQQHVRHQLKPNKILDGDKELEVGGGVGTPHVDGDTDSLDHHLALYPPVRKASAVERF